MKCEQCDFEMAGSRAICPNCGHEVDQGRARRCYRCGRLVVSSWKLCPQCGAELDRRYFAWWMLPMPLLVAVALVWFLLPQVPYSLLASGASLPSFTQVPAIALVPPTATATRTPVPSFTPTPSPSPTASPTPSPTPTSTGTPTAVPTATATETPAVPTQNPRATGAPPVARATARPRAPTAAPTDTPSPTPTDTPSPTPTLAYSAPKLTNPEADSRISGEGTLIELMWEGPWSLGPDEWYGLSLRYLTGGQRQFSGARLKETKWRVPPELAGKADEPDRAYEWDVVLVKVEQTDKGVETSREISPKSETRRFYWR